MTKYRPIDPQQYPRFAGVKTFMRLPHVKETEGVDFAVVGVPWDGGASFRTGQRSGPEAIRRVSALLRPFNMGLQVSIFEHCSGIDYGDTSVVPGYIEDTNQRIEDEIYPLIEAGVAPIMLGGDHSITLPELRAVAKKHGPVALLHYDSHTDTYDEYFGRPYNHGTPFRRAVEEGLIDVEHSIQVGMRGSTYSADDYKDSADLGIEVITAARAREIGLAEVMKRVRKKAGRVRAFVSVDIDFVDPAYAPGTGTPEVGGFTSGEAISLMRGLAGINMVAADVVEVLPEYDPTDNTALVASNLAYELISLTALNKKEKGAVFE